MVFGLSLCLEASGFSLIVSGFSLESVQHTAHSALVVNSCVRGS